MEMINFRKIFWLDTTWCEVGCNGKNVSCVVMLSSINKKIANRIKIIMLLCLQTIPADNVIVEVFVESTSSGNSLHCSMYFWSSLSMSNRIATSRLSVSGTTYVVSGYVSVYVRLRPIHVLKPYIVFEHNIVHHNIVVINEHYCPNPANGNMRLNDKKFANRIKIIL
jgi:hypothetical protein